MRALRRAAAVCAALMILSACSHAEQQTAGARHSWTIPNTLRIAMVTNPYTMNPILSTSQVETFAQAFVFDPLVATDDRGHDVPILAAAVPTLENGGISADGLRITYHLRRGVRWQDGAPFTSHDVAFTVSALMNPNNNVASRHGYDDVARVVTPDAYTAVFVLRHPFAPAIDTFFATSDSPYMIMPAHLLEHMKSLDKAAFNAAPVGTGPYRLTKWLRGDRLEFTAFDGYFRGRPGLRTIDLRIVPDENTIANQLRDHEIDYFYQATPRMYPALKSIANVAIRLVPFNGSDSIMINTARPPLNDARVRRAIGLAIDKQRLVDTLTFGTAIAATEDLPSTIWAWNSKAGTAKADPAEAAALLDAAGWKRTANGMRARDGVPLAFGLAFRSDTSTDSERSVQIAAMLKTAGIAVSLHGYRTGQLYAPASGGGILAGGHYDTGLLTWYAGVDPDDSSQLLCSQRPPNGYDWSRYCSAAMDAAQAVALSKYDRPSRIRAYAEVQNLLAADAPYVYLWWPRQIEAFSDDFHGFAPNGIIESWNAWEWSI